MDGQHIHAKLANAVDEFSYDSTILESWGDFLSSLTSDGVAGWLLTATLTNAGKRQLHMVLDELVHTRGMLLLGRWPRKLFLGDADVQEYDVDIYAPAAAPPTDGSGDVSTAATSGTLWRPVPVAVV